MPDKTVYRTTVTETERYRAATDGLLEARMTAAMELMGSYIDNDPEKLLVDRSGTVVGFRTDDGVVPHGWRQDRDYPELLIPNRRTVDGRAFKEKLDAIPVLNARDLIPGGMPGRFLLWETGSLVTAGLRIIADRLHVEYPHPLPSDEFPSIDWTLWEQVPLSEFYAQVEKLK